MLNYNRVILGDMFWPLNGHPQANLEQYFDVLLKVHLSIFIAVINQLDAQNCCFTVSLFHASTCFEHCCAHHQEVRIILYSIWYHHTETNEWSKMTKKLYFSNFRLLNCFSAIIPDAV